MTTIRRHQNRVKTFLALIIIIAVFYLVSPGKEEASIAVSQSVGTLTADLKSGSPTLTISSGLYYQASLPRKYNAPFSLTKDKNRSVSFIPLDVWASEIQEKEDEFVYHNAYISTDIIRRLDKKLVTERIVIKDHNAPEEFRYSIDMKGLYHEIDAKGDIIFRQTEKEERFNIQRIEKGHIKATMTTDYTYGHPEIFKFSAPFMVDANGNKSDKKDVTIEIQGDRLIVTPNREWLQSHSYPIILDSTVEVIEKEQETVEFGDIDSEDFKPKMKLSKWGDESYISLEYPINEQGEATWEGNKIKLQTNSNIDVEMYSKEPEEVVVKVENEDEYQFIINQHGGVEFDLILKQKPETNVFDYKIEAKGLRFHYQPPLHPDHPTWLDRNDDGIADTFRPEHVVSSYAVYHKTKKNNKYKAGKAFHIYRPKVYDAQGNWVWGVLNLELDEAQEKGT